MNKNYYIKNINLDKKLLIIKKLIIKKNNDVVKPSIKIQTGKYVIEL
jgi:hypothetical protein